MNLKKINHFPRCLILLVVNNMTVFNGRAIEEAFQNTTKFLFGTPLFNFSEYSKWLELRIPKPLIYYSHFSDEPVYLKNYCFLKKLPKNRVVNSTDLNKISKSKLSFIEENKIDDISLKKIQTELNKSNVSYFFPDFRRGNNLNISKTVVLIDSMNVLSSFDVFWSKNIFLCFSVFGTALFGSYRLVNCKFSIHCYSSSNLSACFEMDNSKDCSNSMFCHNVENVNDSMFCFNTKNKRYAIGNLELGRELYYKVKRNLIDEVIISLKGKKKLDFDIYSVL